MSPACNRVRDPRITPNFILHWRWRLHAQLGNRPQVRTFKPLADAVCPLALLLCLAFAAGLLEGGGVLTEGQREVRMIRHERVQNGNGLLCCP